MCVKWGQECVRWIQGSANGESVPWTGSELGDLSPQPAALPPQVLFPASLANIATGFPAGLNLE